MPRRTAAKTADTTTTVTVHVVEPHLVFHDGEQRSGTLTDVPAATAKNWAKHGWATITHDSVVVPEEPTPAK